MSQKAAFLQDEGDAWFDRNHAAVIRRTLPDDDPVLQTVIELLPGRGQRVSILEVGCNEALRLAWLKDHHGASVVGVEPSARAVAAARARGVDARQGTADALAGVPDASADVLIYGFCLYLCDREDLFRITAEAHRVLKSPGWIVIEDFFSDEPRARPYHHREGILSYKMDYRRLFTWHPQYQCYSHTLRHHATGRPTDDPDEWVAVSVMRKLPAKADA